MAKKTKTTKIAGKKKKKQQYLVTFIVSKSGARKPRLVLYHNSKPVSEENTKIVYKDKSSGRLVSREPSWRVVEHVPKAGYGDSPPKANNKARVFRIGRDARSGEFVSTRHALRHPKTYTIERIPQNSPVYFRKDKGK
ncbi:MAG: hypothetical protein UU67_C0042G0009 [Candidatus Daviesbacteria bacterium GW2011_GWB1_41_5]|uniref:Uncharacterized protein n=2 Tax=Patescibacteria group TaxID=1783273 RepID=A0A0G0ZIE0_9BACT|nr:MAG: hypothetical protein UU67_C0042G0009 [Candidatus Daviesbacteria bacterium GW2011_GWB1_41_5]OHB05493.1 MAG: hypothetical protein A3A26_01580 [Candidatus Zambryskibacteria bacterium RIFCSPLOWO2_01_FULL_47_14]